MTARPTEAACQQTIIEAATLAGWRVHAERPARTANGWATPIQGHPGWPDLILVRAGRCLAIELKRRPRQPDPDQTIWLDLLRGAGIDARLVWVPEQMHELIDELTRSTP